MVLYFATRTPSLVKGDYIPILQTINSRRHLQRLLNRLLVYSIDQGGINGKTGVPSLM